MSQESQLPEDFTGLDKQELRQLWRQHFGREAPMRASPEFMIGNLTYQRHCQLHGGLSPGIVRQLHALAVDGQKNQTYARGAIRPGTKFVRVWQGEPHEVTITTECTFLYRGEVYASLSAIARHITGTQWNGRLFFGLRKAAYAA